MTLLNWCRLCNTFFKGDFDHHIFLTHSPKELDLLDGIQHLLEEQNQETEIKKELTDNFGVKNEPSGDRKTIKVDQNLTMEFEDGSSKNCELEMLKYKKLKYKTKFSTIKQQFQELEEENTRLKESMNVLNEKLNETKLRVKTLESCVDECINKLKSKKNSTKKHKRKRFRNYNGLLTKEVKVKLKRLNIDNEMKYIAI